MFEVMYNAAVDSINETCATTSLYVIRAARIDAAALNIFTLISVDLKTFSLKYL